MTAAAEPEIAPSTGEFLLRFGFSAAFVVALLVILAPVREALVWLTMWSIESSAGLVRLDAWTGDLGLMTFSSAGGDAFSYRVVEECTAVAVIGLYSVAIFAMPGIAWRRRWIGLLVGSAALLTVNWVRLLSLAWLGVHRPSAFDLAHVWLWQAISVALVVVAWLAWLRWATKASAVTGGHRNWLWFGGTTAAIGTLFQVGGLAGSYSGQLDLALQGVERLVSALPYQTLRFATAANEWTMQVRWVSLTIAVGLATAMTGPVAKRRLTSGVLAIGLVPVAQFIGRLIEATSEARFALTSQETYANFVQIPLLVVVHGLPTVVPLVLWYRASARLTDAVAEPRLQDN